MMLAWLRHYESSMRKVSMEVFVVLIAVAILLGSKVGIDAYRKKERGQVAAIDAPQAKVGDSAYLKDVDFSKHNAAFLIITSPSCHFCRDSVTFHRSIINEGRRQGIPVYTLTPGGAASTKLVEDIGSTPTMHKQWRDFRCCYKITAARF